MKLRPAVLAVLLAVTVAGLAMVARAGLHLWQQPIAPNEQDDSLAAAEVDTVQPGGFRVQGNVVNDPSGRRFIVKGITTQEGVFLPQLKSGEFATRQLGQVNRDFDIVQRLAANTVRIFVTGKYVYYPTTMAINSGWPTWWPRPDSMGLW